MIGRYCYRQFLLVVLAFQGIPSPIDREGLLSLLTNVLSLASLFNAVYGSGQYDNLAFPPNYPSAMRGTIPRDNVGVLLTCPFFSRCRFVTNPGYLRKLQVGGINEKLLTYMCLNWPGTKYI